MELGVLGPVEVRHGGRTLPTGSARERLVLAILLLDAGRIVSTDRLIDALWNDPPPTAKGQVHNLIRSLRRRLGPADEELIATRPLGYELVLDDHALDLIRFRQLADEGRQAAEARDHGRAKATLDEAIALWRGPALANVPDEIAGSLRQALHDERLAAEELRLASALALGQHEEALPEVERLITEHPYREGLHEMRMRALAAVGRRADALAAYREAYERLVDDLGVEPGPALRDLEARILRGEDVAAGSVTRVVPRQLPMAPTMLTGRDKLLHEISADLRPDDASAPAVGILVGPGGVGKTTLAVAAAHQVSATFANGQLYANLRGSHENPADPLDVLGGFLRALGVDVSALPPDLDERAALYRSTLAQTRTLVVLDDAANEEQVRPLLPGADGCGVLVTSRRQLGALMESRRWTVPTLRVDDSVQLIRKILGGERLGIEPDAAEAVATACGHLPLALSIAAARLATRPERSLSEFADLLADERRRLDELRLGDLDVRASIGLTYGSLDPSQKRLFRRLGLVTMSDWPAWVAYEVTGTDDVDRQLDALADVHLVQPLGRDPAGQSRYRLHDLVAEYARERAHDEDSAEDRTAAVRRVVDGWLALATAADEHVAHGQWTADGLSGPPLPTHANAPTASSAATWFEIEKDNLARAVTLAGDVGAHETAAKLALRTSGFLTVRSYGEQRLQMLLAALRHDATDTDALRLRVRLLGALLSAYISLARHAELQAVVEQQLHLARRLGDARAEYFALREAGRAALRLNRLGEAVEYYEAAIAVDLPAEDERLLAWAVGALGIVHIERGEPERGEPMLARHVAAERARGRSMVYGVMLMAHAETLAILERLDEAQAALDEMRSVCQELGDDYGIACSELRSADVDVRAGRTADATARLDRSLPLLDARADTGRDVHGLRVATDLAAAEHRWTAAAELAEQAVEIRRALGQPLDAARDLARAEMAHRALGDDAAGDDCRREWQSILDDLELDERSLLLPAFLLGTS